MKKEVKADTPDTPEKTVKKTLKGTTGGTEPEAVSLPLLAQVAATLRSAYNKPYPKDRLEKNAWTKALSEEALDLVEACRELLEKERKVKRWADERGDLTERFTYSQGCCEIAGDRNTTRAERLFVEVVTKFYPQGANELVSRLQREGFNWLEINLFRAWVSEHRKTQKIN
jgi:hypothetical protein